MAKGVYFCEELVHLAAGAVFYFTCPAVVFVAQEIVAEEGIVHEALEHDVQETSLTEIEQATTA